MGSIMRSLENIRAITPKSQIFQGQLQHIMLAVLLCFGAISLLESDPAGSKFLGLDSVDWALLSIAAAVLHQVIVALVFRLQLHFGLMTRLFGENALKIWGVVFLPLLFFRPLSILATGIADYGALTEYRTAQLALGALLLVIAGWGAHSVLKYFTINRALGGDHFYDRFLNMPMVDKGAFRYSSNAMYGIVFLGLWGIALLTGSWNALVLALFQHAYIWVHMYCTEDPDMRVLYR